MAQDRPATTTTGTQHRGASYAHEWNRFVTWAKSRERDSLPATHEDVAAYLKERFEAGAKASTIKVAAAAISHHHRNAGFEAPNQRGVAMAALSDLARDESPRPTRALPLDLDCYLAIRKTAFLPRTGRGGRTEGVSNARRRGELDVAMIGLMAGRQASGQRGGRVDLGRPGTGPGRVRPPTPWGRPATGWLAPTQ